MAATHARSKRLRVPAAEDAFFLECLLIFREIFNPSLFHFSSSWWERERNGEVEGELAKNLPLFLFKVREWYEMKKCKIEALKICRKIYRNPVFFPTFFTLKPACTRTHPLHALFFRRSNQARQYSTLLVWAHYGSLNNQIIGQTWYFIHSIIPNRQCNHRYAHS